MLPRIVVAADEDDELGALLVRCVTGAPGGGPFDLEFCGDRGALSDRIRTVRPAALVVALRDGAGAPSAPLVEQIKRHYPRVPVLVACLDEDTHGHDVLNAARAGAEHFAFNGIDDLGAVLRGLVSPAGEPRSVEPAGVSGTGGAGRPGGGGGCDSDEDHPPEPGEPGEPGKPGTPAGRKSPRASGRWDRVGRGTPTRPGPAVWTRHRFLSRDRRRTPIAPVVLPSTVPTLLRRIIQACLGMEPLTRVDRLAELLGTTKHSLRRDLRRRGWPAAHVLLRWGKLFRGAVVAEEARIGGSTASQESIAAASGFGSVKNARRAYRSLTGVGMRAVSRDGIAALLPAFFAATGVGSPEDEP